MVICEIKEEKRGDGWREEKGEESQKEEEREFSKKVGSVSMPCSETF